MLLSGLSVSIVDRTEQSRSKSPLLSHHFHIRDLAKMRRIRCNKAILSPLSYMLTDIAKRSVCCETVRLSGCEKR